MFGNTVAWLSGMGAGSLDMIEEAEKEVKYNDVDYKVKCTNIGTVSKEDQYQFLSRLFFKLQGNLQMIKMGRRLFNP